MNTENKKQTHEAIKELWEEHRRVIKFTAIGIGLGACYGFIKGINMQNKLCSQALSEVLAGTGHAR